MRKPPCNYLAERSAHASQPANLYWHRLSSALGNEALGGAPGGALARPQGQAAMHCRSTLSRGSAEHRKDLPGEALLGPLVSPCGCAPPQVDGVEMEQKKTPTPASGAPSSAADKLATLPSARRQCCASLSGVGDLDWLILRWPARVVGGVC